MRRNAARARAACIRETPGTFTGYLVVELYFASGTKAPRSLEENLRVSRLYAEKTFGVKA